MVSHAMRGVMFAARGLQSTHPSTYKFFYDGNRSIRSYGKECEANAQIDSCSFPVESIVAAPSSLYVTGVAGALEAA